MGELIKLANHRNLNRRGPIPLNEVHDSFITYKQALNGVWWLVYLTIAKDGGCHEQWVEPIDHNKRAGP